MGNMPKIDDQNYLTREQYRQPDRLNARILIHQRFSTNRQGWQPWVFERLCLADTHRLVDLGCGPADLWLENQARIPDGVRIVLGDLSRGMVMEARHRVKDDLRFEYFMADIQSIPLPDHAFDRVVANHMFYHVPDIDRGISEMARILAPGGLAMAATNGPHTMRELYALIREIAPHYEMPPAGAAARFSLENGPVYFEKCFSRVWVEQYEDSLWVTEAQPLIDYLYSSTTLTTGLEGSARNQLLDLFQRRIARDGGIHIGKQGGVILGQRSAGRIK
jgi:ubiquinone/menaquinone biosynthesis C-methylase UbiE